MPQGTERQDSHHSIVNVKENPRLVAPPTVGYSSTVKYASLILLTLQNAALILVMRYVRTRTGEMFMSTTAVVMAEIVKLIVCLFIILCQEGSVWRWCRHLYDNIWCQPWDCAKVAMPSLIYALQNNLLYVAISNLEATTFQVTQQLKILTTALFSVLMLGKHLRSLQWVALVMLFLGVSLAQLTPAQTTAPPRAVKGHQHKHYHPALEQNHFIGLMAVILSSFMSGFASVYFQKILKGTPQSMWLRNVQFSAIGIVAGWAAMEVNDGTNIDQKGFFMGWDWVVWVVILLQAAGGLLVVIVIKTADVILNGFATSAAIVIYCILSMYFFAFKLSVQFVLGSITVIISIMVYSNCEYRNKIEGLATPTPTVGKEFRFPTMETV